MAYFPNAFKKTIVVSEFLTEAQVTNTAGLTAGQVSLFDARTFLSIAPDATSCCQVLFAAGAPYANDRSWTFPRRVQRIN